MKAFSTVLAASAALMIGGSAMAQGGGITFTEETETETTTTTETRDFNQAEERSGGRASDRNGSNFRETTTTTTTTTTVSQVGTNPAGQRPPGQTSVISVTTETEETTSREKIR